MLVNDTHKMAAKAAIARRQHRGERPEVSARLVTAAAEELGLLIGDISDIEDAEKYAEGIAPGAVNRQWRQWQVLAPLTNQIDRRANAIYLRENPGPRRAISGTLEHARRFDPQALTPA